MTLLLRHTAATRDAKMVVDAILLQRKAVAGDEDHALPCHMADNCCYKIDFDDDDDEMGDCDADYCDFAAGNSMSGTR